MSLDLALAEDGDLALDLLGRARLIGGADRVGQQVKVTLLAFLGEWFLDTTFGVPYFEEILVKNPDRSTIEAVLRARILDVPGVTRVGRLDLDVDRTARTLRVAFEAESAEGRAKDVVTLRFT
ncbi:hypothetical protein LMG3410_04878 [Achromobacter aegrifaciens]|uniref:hypothetical protein n=1 Tax=Achromobacter aegrifaciens TaxID=1287736 RepID=UPI001467AA70|nr:hypothetical protein [Achromobacter aegrifaciens]CAB3911913.1 hypothetical protein LMG3410_04878 [Achromobacter aegrifaciens]